MEVEKTGVEEEAGPQTVFVRSQQSDDFLTMVLRHSNRSFNFKRPKTEPCEKLCARIATNLRNSKGKKKMKKKRSADEMDCVGDDEVSVGILDASRCAVGGEVCSEEALQAGGWLQVGECRYEVLRNAPGISHLRIPRCILVGCPALVEVCVEFCEMSDCLLEWFLHRPQPDSPPLDSPGWMHALNARSLVADPSQIGHWVKVTASPRGGLPRSELAKGPIQPGPTDRSPVLQQHEKTRALSSGKAFRLLSYNLLADLYADSDHSRNQLFPYCPTHFLVQDYRRQVILWEIQGYNADLLCLQEVDKDFFEVALKPFFAPEFGAVFLQKGKSTKEGVALFFRSSRFQLQEDLSLPSISAALHDLALPVDISKSEKFAARWADRNQCLLALQLRCVDTGERLVVATTHLFFHPLADNMRLLQAAVCLKHLEVASKDAAVILAGDFNSDPRNGVFELMCKGRTRATQSDWYSGGKDEFFGSPIIEHHLSLQSAYDPSQLEFTNYTAGFRGVLDYIFFQSDRLQLHRTIPLPPQDAIMQEIALPNELFPSDHLALIAEFSF